MSLPNTIRERQNSRAARNLRKAIAGLTIEVRRAMLGAVDSEDLIVGAYTDRRGHVCPMLAAHRRGARMDVGKFPRAWDGFCRARRARLATRRELEILKALLQESVSQSVEYPPQHQATEGEARAGAPA
jgi:hypothetical protein